MKSLMDLENGECKFAMTDSPETEQAWAHARLGASGGGVVVKGRMVGGGSYPHQFCAEAVQPGSVYCPAHHAACYRGLGKDPVALEAMVYATDHSVLRAGTGYAEHTDPVDVELARGDKPKTTAETAVNYAAGRHHAKNNNFRPAR